MTCVLWKDDRGKNIKIMESSNRHKKAKKMLNNPIL